METVSSRGAVVAVCRCRQAMRLLARLVRGLPAEAPAVVVRQNGLRSIVRIVEDAVAEAAAAADGPAALPVETMAATGDALEVCGSTEVFVLLVFALAFARIVSCRVGAHPARFLCCSRGGPAGGWAVVDAGIQRSVCR